MSYVIRIAGLTLALEWPEASLSSEVSVSESPFRLAAYDSFQVAADEPSHILHIRREQQAGQDRLDRNTCVFDSGGVWAAFQSNGVWRLANPSPSVAECKRLLSWLPGQKDFDLWLAPDISPDDPLGDLTLPFFTSLFAYHQGVMLHAAAVESKEGAWLFVGPSGAGKSHWAYQWQKQGGKVIDEDRIVLREQDGHLWAFGTPWHPKHYLFSRDGAPIKRLFFLRETEADTCEPIKAVKAAALLLRSSFMPMYDAEALKRVIDTVTRTSLQAQAFLAGHATDGKLPSYVD